MNDASPVRGKRRRVDRERIRVTRACDLCKKKKLRCSGTQPCELCVRSDQECEFTALYTRGKLPSIQSATGTNDDALVHTNRGTSMDNVPQDNHAVINEVTLGVVVPEATALFNDDIPMPSIPRLAEQFTEDNIQRSSRNSPEPIQTDQDGNYIGPSSGVLFLSRALRKIQDQATRADSGVSTFTFGDTPLPSFDPYFLILPSRKEAITLIRKHSDFAFPTHRFLHSPTVEAWCEQFYDDIESSKPADPGSRQRIAVILMILAQAKLYVSAHDGVDSSMINSAAYFSAADHHLNADAGVIRLEGIQARLAQCFWLLTQSRVNHSWTLFGTVTNLALALGLHRNKRPDPSLRTSVIDLECRKRVFWSAYSLDNYLSAALGRPRRFHEEDIDQQLPLFLDDNEIIESRVLTGLSNKQSIMAAAVYHAKLSKIISGILRDIYGIKTTRLDNQIRAIERYDELLNEWRDEVGHFLDLPNIELMVLVCQRQHTVLHLAFSHAMILLHRPALLRHNNGPGATTMSQYHHKLKTSKDKCLQAATKVVSILRDLTRKNQMFRAFWFTQYYAFSALVVLFVNVIQNRNETSSDLHNYLPAAQQGLQDLSACASGDSYAQRYVAVLTELQIEAIKPTSNSAPTSSILELPRSVPNDVMSTGNPGQLPFENVIRNGAMWNDTTQSQQLNMPENQVTSSHENYYATDNASTNVIHPILEPGFYSAETFAMVGLGELDLLFANSNEDIFGTQLFDLSV